MTTRSEREKAQKLNEQHQAILSKMLREEDNKYCADCEAKGAPSIRVYAGSSPVGRNVSVNLSGGRARASARSADCSPLELNLSANQQANSRKSTSALGFTQWEAGFPPNGPGSVFLGSVGLNVRSACAPVRPQVRGGRPGISEFSSASAALESTGTWEFTYPESSLSTWTNGPRNKSRAYRTWATPKPGASTRPTFQTASEDLRRTSILLRARVCFSLVFACGLLFLNFALRAVEFFIRDKYEKKKYYSKNGLDRSSPKDKKEKEPDRGGKVSSHSKSEESRPAPKVSPVKPAEPPVNLLGLDAPAAASPNNGNTSTSQNSDLDIFGPMVSNPLPSSSSAAQFSQVSSSNSASTPTQAAAGGGASSGSAQGDLDLFSESSGSSSTKAEDASKKTLSKDSILSLYGTSSMSTQAPPAGMFMAPSQMQFPVQAAAAGYQAFPGMGAGVPPTTVMGAMMAQSGAAMMGPNPGMMVGMTMPNGFMGNAPAAGMMGMAPRMVGPQGGAMPAGMVPAQGMYAIQPGQQTQWSMGQARLNPLTGWIRPRSVCLTPLPWDL
uniref:Small ArfGAP 1 n=1 Tax=Oryzias melastigma TaxID=30732 RepID=A0A3B3DF05_ORYME